jgi:hypothetical protein
MLANLGLSANDEHKSTEDGVESAITVEHILGRLIAIALCIVVSLESDFAVHSVPIYHHGSRHFWRL